MNCLFESLFDGRTNCRNRLMHNEDKYLTEESGGADLAQDLSRLFSLTNVEAVAYRDFSQQRAERRSLGRKKPEEAATLLPETIEAVHSEDIAVADSPSAAVELHHFSEAGQGTRGMALQIESRVAPSLMLPPTSRPAIASVQLQKTQGYLSWSTLAVYSPYAQVGCSTICANLACVFHADGGDVLLVDGTGNGNLSHWFGAAERRVGMRRFGQAGENRPSILVMSANQPDSDWFRKQVEPQTAQVSRTIIDLGHEATPFSDEALLASQVLLVPLLPTLDSLLAFARLDAWLARLRVTGRQCPQVCYVMNRVDTQSELHGKARELIAAHCQETLLAAELEAQTDTADALAHRMTVTDFAPSSRLAAGFSALGDALLHLPLPQEAAHPACWVEL